VLQLWLVGGFTPSEKYESQLGSLFPIYGKIKNVPNHQPDGNVSSPKRLLVIAAGIRFERIDDICRGSFFYSVNPNIDKSDSTHGWDINRIM
jgi:hypothetical protein